MSEKVRKRLRFWAGFASAVAFVWLACALIIGFDYGVIRYIGRSQDGAWWVAMVVLQLLALPVFIGFAAGFVSLFFWHSLMARSTCERWGTPVILTLAAPAMVSTFASAGAAAFDAANIMGLLLVVGVPLFVALVAFHRGVAVGFRWWHEDYWR